MGCGGPRPIHPLGIPRTRKGPKAQWGGLPHKALRQHKVKSQQGKWEELKKGGQETGETQKAEPFTLRQGTSL